MIPQRELPCHNDFSHPEQYVDELLHFAHSTPLFQMLCGGVHILDFFTTDPGVFHATVPEEWRAFLLSYDIMRLLDLFLRDDLDDPNLLGNDDLRPPESLLQYAKSLRRLSLGRSLTPQQPRLPVLPRTVSVGMKPKKMHEVVHFADYVDRLCDAVADDDAGNGITHLVDLGSGQNYLGRALASAPYHRRVVAVEGRENNVEAARWYDVKSGLARPKNTLRNKKMWNEALGSLAREQRKDRTKVTEALGRVAGADEYDFRPVDVGDAEYVDVTGASTGAMQYVSGRVDSGDLSDVIAGVAGGGEPRLMAVSIHSCGNLSHHGVRSLVLNREVRAVAIVGCCYNLMTERLGPPTYKHPFLRASLQPLNGRVVRESERRDPQGFPMSRRFATYTSNGIDDGGNEGLRLNITARMMACQAPGNWTAAESQGFFTRHFFRAVLQRIFLDRGVVSHVWHRGDSHEDGPPTPFNTSTNPVVIGALRKRCYASIKTYVRGAVEKLTTSAEYKQYADVMRDKMGDITDEEIERYEATYLPRKKELCVIWSLMALSALVVESLIVVDRWCFLKEQDVVKHAWVESVFDYGQSPRNLVVVGIKGDHTGGN